LSDAVTLGGAYDAGEASPVGLHGDLLKWAVGMQQQRRGLFMLKLEHAA